MCDISVFNLAEAVRSVRCAFMAGGGLICGLDEWNQEVFDCVEELRAKPLSAGALFVIVYDIENMEELQFDDCLRPFPHAQRQEKKS